MTRPICVISVILTKLGLFNLYANHGLYFAFVRVSSRGIVDRGFSEVLHLFAVSHEHLLAFGGATGGWKVLPSIEGLVGG